MRVYDKSDNIYFPIVNFPFLDGDVPLAPSDIMWCLPLSHVISFCTYMFKFCICNNVSDFIYRDLVITDTLLKRKIDDREINIVTFVVNTHVKFTPRKGYIYIQKLTSSC
jgi:hypothetical protein